MNIRKNISCAKKYTKGNNENLIGKIYNNIKILKDSGKRDKNGCIIWIVYCFKCNKTKKLSTKNIKRYMNCGCQRGKGKKKIKHGLSENRTYVTWCSMKQRCYNPNNISFKNYGGRGIAVCRRWRNSFENFLNDMGKKPKKLTIDRIDNNGSYGPWNCRWSTYSENLSNRKRY